MLTNEAVLKVFADYLKEDTEYEVVMTSRGYTVMCWDNCGKDWNTVVYCPTPEALRDALLDGYASFAEMRITGCERDLTAQEEKQIEAQRQEFIRECEEAVT